MKRSDFRSGLEYKVACQLDDLGVAYEYENLRVKYQRRESTYTPDFELPNGIIIEAKGRFTSSDRSKHLRIKEQHPELDIRFVYSNSNNMHNKNSSTTYAGWCERYGFRYSDKTIPKEWIDETP